MRSLAICGLLSLAIGPALGQTPPKSKDTAPLTQPQSDLRDAAEIEIDLLTRQNVLLSQIIAQNQRGLVVYPVALSLPGPINCQGDCRATISTICHGVKYPNGYAYPATVPSDTVGNYANGVCYGP